MPVLVKWPAGTRFSAEVAIGLPDEPRFRALRSWWREALRQTVSFSLAETDSAALARIELTVDPEACALTATLRSNGQERVLAGGSYVETDGGPDLLAAIDQLAWSARLALGERVATPMAVAEITSRNPAVVLAVADADELLATGAFASAHQTLLLARKQDGGAPFVLDRLAAVELLLGKGDVGARIATEALAYSARTSPTTQHRLARTLLMARATQQPSQTAAIDRELLRLSLVAQRERPHDDEVLWTQALARNFLGEFETAMPLLEQLVVRLPTRAPVHYHLGWACLATHEPQAAAEHLAEAALRLPGPWILLPRAIALYEAGRNDELERLFDAVLQEFDRTRTTTLTHQVLRMQAAHAILRNDRYRARELLFADLRWLLKHPLTLAERFGEFAEMGEVLVRLGSSDELPSLLNAVQQQNAGTAAADACAFVSGMHQLATTGRSTDQLQVTLARGGDSAWAARLAGFAHELRGEVADSQTQFARAARLSSSPMTKALLAKSLALVGRTEEAERLRQALRREMTTLHLRQNCQHPLFGPELAYAFVLQ